MVAWQRLMSPLKRATTAGMTAEILSFCPAPVRRTHARTTAAVSGSAPSSYGRSSNSYSTAVRVPTEEPEHYQYMSARCRSLDSGIRSAYSRGIKPDVVEGMRREYKRDCREQEQEAVGPGELCVDRRLDRVRIARPPGLAKGRHVVDIHTQQDLVPLRHRFSPHAPYESRPSPGLRKRDRLSSGRSPR